jgi:hypothetical protein
MDVNDAYTILVRIPEGKRVFRRPRHKEKDNIKIDFKEMGLEVVDWIHLVDDGLMNMILNLLCP